jgi:hypothetical protein
MNFVIALLGGRQRSFDSQSRIRFISLGRSSQSIVLSLLNFNTKKEAQKKEEFKTQTEQPLYDLCNKSPCVMVTGVLEIR